MAGWFFDNDDDGQDAEFHCECGLGSSLVGRDTERIYFTAQKFHLSIHCVKKLEGRN